MNRRIFLLGTAGAGLVAATGISAFALTRMPTSTLRPWQEAGLSRSDARRFVVEHALLAPNPHNRQPWIVELTGPDTMTLWCDLDRRLPQTDPFDRQIVIGLGAFIELASIAASALGAGLSVAPFPEGEPSPRLDSRSIAHLRIVHEAGRKSDPLFAHIKARRTTRQPFDMTRAAPAEALAAIRALATPDAAIATETDAARVKRLRDLTWDAWLIEAATKRTYLESIDLTRIGRAEIDANPDGISLGGPLMEGLSMIGMLTREKLADPSSSAAAEGQRMYKAMLAATSAYLTVVARDESRLGQLAAGRAYVRANLAATGLGLVMHPVSQALQEFPEMATAKGEVEKSLGIEAPRRLHMLARLGYGPTVPAAPRWTASTRIRPA